MVAQRPRDYELVMILSPEVNEDEARATVDRIDGIISAAGGEVGEHEGWGVRRLAYPIGEFTEGNYFLTRFGTDASAIAELDRGLTAAEDVVRHLIYRP